MLVARQSPYTAYARHYDHIGQRRFGERAALLILELLERECRPVESVVDLACGTGAATYIFADGGLKTTGVDLSEDMLEIARLGRVTGAAPVAWLQADMRSFECDSRFDLCTCFYDAVNYLETLSDFTDFARACGRVLQPRGILAFDINTRRKLTEHWSDMTILAADNPDLFLVYRSWFDDKRGVSPLVMTGFERAGDGSWRRFDEEHVETAFAIEDLSNALEAAGFAHIRVFDLGDSSPRLDRLGGETSFRVLFVAQHETGEAISP